MRNRVPRYEETTVNGVTEMTPAGYTRLPGDTRALVKKAMFVVAVGFTLLAMAISMAAIGALFSQVVPAYIGFPGAAVFDGLWLYALMGEWISDTHPRARTAAQRAGVVFVAGSMAAIVLEAYTLHHVAVGVALALVPLGVKAAWWLRFETTQFHLPAAYQNRLEKERAQVYTELAIERETRELNAARNLTAELRNLGRNQVPEPVPEQVPEQAELTRLSAGTFVVTGSGTTEREALEDAERTARELGGHLEGKPVAGTGTPTELVKELIRNGATDAGTIRNKLVELGSVRVPSDSYIRRLVRDADKGEGYYP
jgi:hypothetical protein